MKVVFIGAGNLATQLASELYKYAFDIVQVYSRTKESAAALATTVDAVPVTDISAIIPDADIYIFSVKDYALEELVSQLAPNNGLWVHTAGSIPMDIFSQHTSHYGVLYPFQTFSKIRTVDWNTIPVFIEASDKTSLNTLSAIAKQLSDNVVELSSEQRKYVHLTGVFACNFTNHMYALSEQFLNRVGLPFSIALPLIDETALKVHSLTPQEAQTGPAIRFDENVMDKQLELIEDEKIREIYKLISEDIHRINN